LQRFYGEGTTDHAINIPEGLTPSTPDANGVIAYANFVNAIKDASSGLASRIGQMVAATRPIKWLYNSVTDLME
jgi:hypothetical protein